MDSAPVSKRTPNLVRGLRYLDSAIAVLLANRRYGLTGALVAVVASLVVQVGIVAPAERRRRRRPRPRE